VVELFEVCVGVELMVTVGVGAAVVVSSRVVVLEVCAVVVVVGIVVVVGCSLLVDVVGAAVAQERKLPLSFPCDPLPWLSSQFPCPLVTPGSLLPLWTHGSPPKPGGHSGAVSVSPRRSLPAFVFVVPFPPAEGCAATDGPFEFGPPAAATADNAPAEQNTTPKAIVTRPLLTFHHLVRRPPGHQTVTSSSPGFLPQRRLEICKARRVRPDVVAE
jgi:hypothetical protein